MSQATIIRLKVIMFHFIPSIDVFPWNKISFLLCLLTEKSISTALSSLVIHLLVTFISFLQLWRERLEIFLDTVTNQLLLWGERARSTKVTRNIDTHHFLINPCSVFFQHRRGIVYDEMASRAEPTRGTHNSQARRVQCIHFRLFVEP